MNDQALPAPLLLIPGMLCDERVWRHQSAALKPRCNGLQVADVTRDNAMEDIARHILSNAPDQFSLAGFSFGGIVALEIFRQAPERVLRLALIGTNAANEKPASQEPRLHQMERVARGEFEKVLNEELLPTYLGDAHADDTLLRWEIIHMGMMCGPEVFLRQCEALNSRMDYRPLLSAIEIPSLVMCGAEEKVCPVWLHEKLAQQITHAKLVIVPEAGHFAPMEAPEATSAAMLDWLSRSEG